MELKFLKSATRLEECPQDLVPEVALLGRSNSGKSSFINGLFGGKIAKVSQTPGKTRLINFFTTKSYRWVDLPGYGFAARSHGEREAWREMINSFLGARGNLYGSLLLMDIRRSWSEDEENLVHWLQVRDLPVAVVLTKSDKLSGAQAKQQKIKIHKASGVEAVFLSSTLKKIGFTEIEEFVFSSWIKGQAK